MTVLHRNDTNPLQFTTDIFKIPPSTSLHFATRLWRSRVVRLSWSSRFFIQPAASKMTDGSSYRVSTFILYTSLFIQPHKQKSNGVMSGDSNSSLWITIQNYTHVHMNFSILTLIDTVIFQNIRTLLLDHPVYKQITKDAPQWYGNYYPVDAALCSGK